MLKKIGFNSLFFFINSDTIYIVKIGIKYYAVVKSEC